MNAQAIVLAGGMGTRLQSVVSDVPKPMAPVAGRPFLAYILDQICRTNISEVFLSVGYKHEVIQQFFGHKYKHLSLTYVVEKEALGTGGGIRLAAEKCNANEIIVFNGDTFFDVNIDALLSNHQTNQNDQTIALKNMEMVNRYGIVECDESLRILSFQEKTESLKSGWINGGIYCLNRETFLAKTEASKFSMEVDFMERFVQSLKLGGFPSDGYFIDIGIPEDFKKANTYFETN